MPETQEVNENQEFEDAFKEFSTGEVVEPEAVVQEEVEVEAAPEVEPELEMEEVQISVPEEPAGDSEVDVDAILAENEELKKYKHQVDSAHGRISYLQRQNDELTGKVSQLSSTPAPDVEPVQDDDWKEIEEDFPEIATAVKKRLAAAEAKLTEVVDPLIASNEQFAQRDARAREEQELARLETVYPDWRTTVQSKEFADWFLVQPDGTQALYKSEASADSINLLNLYAGVSHKPEPEPKEEPKDTAALDALKEKRAQQLKQGRTVETTPAGQRTDKGSTGSFESEFAAFSKQKDKERAQRAGGYSHY